MNRLKLRDGSGNIWTGGFPLDLEDLDWNDASLREGFYGLLSAFGVTPATSFIISGCVVTAPNYTAGYISLNGEILKVDAGVLPTLVGVEVHYWDIDVTFDSRGLEPFESGISNDTYEVRKASVKKGTPAAGTYMPLGAPTIQQLIADFAIAEMPNRLDPYHVVGDPSSGLGTSYFGSPAWRLHSTSNLRFRKDPFGYVRIEGWVGVGQGGSIFQLPVGYRPLTYGLFPITKKVMNVGTVANRLFIDSSGLVFVNGADTYDGSEELSLDGIIFKAA